MDDSVREGGDRHDVNASTMTGDDFTQSVEMHARANLQGRAARRELLDGFELHPVGVVIREGVDQRTWYEFGKLLQRVDYAWNWIVADWLAFGDHKYGDQVYRSAARLFGKSPRSWEDYAYIARNVRFSERSEILPMLTHKPIARFHDDRELQRKLLGIAEEHSLSKSVFEKVIRLYLDGKSYYHLLPANVTPLVRAQWRADKERQRVKKRVLAGDRDDWLKYAREQAEGWQQLVAELMVHLRGA